MGVLLAWMVEIGVITWRDLTKKQDKALHTINGFPLPADYLATFLVFGALAFVPKDSGAAKPAVLTAWAVVLASYLNVFPILTNQTSSTPAQAGAPPTNFPNIGGVTTPSSTIAPGG